MNTLNTREDEYEDRLCTIASFARQAKLHGSPH